jgi:hypothetical protein
LAYIDRDFTYSQVPPSLVGATYIRTANDDKFSQGDSFLSFDVNQPVTVMVAHDDRYTTKPAWLSGFVDSGLGLQINVPFSLYSRGFGPGTVVLGGNVDPSDSGDYTMYTVVVLPATAPAEPPPAPQNPGTF